ncbi:MAG TPA: hypothetical protein VK826_08350, partial [Bacteroidia bacterium]|nr:hypothetical protein [Bacteroidia bacterium]
MSANEEKTSEKKAQVKSGTPDADTTRRVKDVIDAEKKYLGLDDTKQVRGFAVSGGGIRSASFGLGVMQALVANNQLEKMDYMSTVSGGGYLGSALTWALKQGGTEAGTTQKKFPLGRRGEAARGTATESNPNLDAGDNKLLNFIRQHCSYLVPTSSLGMVSFAAVVFRSILISLFVYFCMLVILMSLFEWGHFFKTPLVENAAGGDPFHLIPKGIFISVSLACIAICIAWGFLYSLRTFFASDGVLNEYLWFITGQKLIGYLWKASFVCALIGTLPYFVGWMHEAESMIVASGSTLFGTLVGLWQYRKSQKNEESTGAASELTIYLGAFALMYGLMLLAYLASGIFFLEDRLNLVHPLWLAVFALITLIFAVFVNLNLVGPHRIWRDRLMEAFMPDAEAVEENQWKPAKKADSALMEDMCDAHNPRPYHIVNTNIILAESPQVKFKGRGGDNFIISRLYCGSDATGWRTTKTFHKSGTRGITLATAMATSAAALNPNAGVSGEGATRNLIVSILLSTLNLRLGYWANNPSRKAMSSRPNFLTPGLTSEISRNGFTETDSRVLLSDGGHFENLAIYELIRRKLD